MARSLTALLVPGQGRLDPAVADHLMTAPRATRIMEGVHAACAREGEFPVLTGLVSATDEAAGAAPDVPGIAGQLRLLTTGLMAFDLLRRQGTPADLLIGHSLGEIGALCAAGALSAEDAARCVIVRTRALHLHGDDGGLLALSATAEQATALITLAGAERTVLACLNAPAETVLSGPHAELVAVSDVARRLDLAATLLPAPFAFHHPSNAKAAAALREALAGLTADSLDVPVYSPVLGRPVEQGDDLAELLAVHLLRPVRFADALRHAHRQNVATFVECGAGNVLTRLAADTLQGIETRAQFRAQDIEAKDTRAKGIRAKDREAEDGAAKDDAAKDDAAEDANARDAASRASATGSDGPEPDLSAGDSTSTHRETPPAGDDAAVGDDGGQVADEIREIYATTLGYPVEVFEDDAELEADLGIDSLKRTELLTTVARHYGITLDTAKAATLFTIADVIADVRAEKLVSR